ncbi:MAG: serine/threonine-protein kinase PknD [Parachlamydiaceae bacterium]|nr:serine/threonine-protein kinase PknD [Parachlamydiaceae bacterium]
MQNESNKHSFTCKQCLKHIEVLGSLQPQFCPYCGVSSPYDEEIKDPSSPIIIRNRYRVIDNIGTGGMGEVLLVYDQLCERRIALKKIRSDLIEHTNVRNRFLKEAHITCQLTHPAIIPIYTIHGESKTTYYTMPFVEGDTLKQIIRKVKTHPKKGQEHNHTGASIPALMRIFITVCQAIAYAHSKGIIHRDLKLENIIVGKYGEVFILDWGLAKFIHTTDEKDENFEPLTGAKHAEITKLGKIVGTIAYMSPETALGKPSNFQTDIYSLGIILYQMLALRHPYKRGKTISEFQKTVTHEKWIDPITAAPYREIPRILSRIAKKCLSVDLKERYSSVDELIHDLENYLEGRSEWFFITQLDIHKKDDWEFQENVLLAEHMALTLITEQTEWVSLMISKTSFSGNTKIETDVCIRDKGHGLGFLLSIPETGERAYINEGYCLWLGSDNNRTTKLLRSNVEVMHASDIFLKRNQWYRIRVEKIEQSIHLYIDDTLQLSYIAHTPLIGTHVGMLSRDADFEIEPLNVYVGSLNIMVNCLAVPDAFLAHRDFSKALSEYRRIAYSFPDRSEGREAIFRGGLTLIEQAKTSSQKEKSLDLAREEFEKLHKTPGAPLEYLGKALVYQALNDEEEEIKCFDLAYRRYPHHPLLPILQEQIISRIHEVSRYHRIAAYNFILLAIRHLPLNDIDTHTRRLFNSLQKHWEYLPFIEEEKAKDKALYNLNFSIQMAFWLAKPYILSEIIDDLSRYHPFAEVELGNAFFSIIELGSWKFAKEKIETLKNEQESHSKWVYLENAIACHEEPLNNVLDRFSINEQFDFNQWRTLWYCFNYALDTNQTNLIHTYGEKYSQQELPYELQLYTNIQRIWAYLLDKNWNAAGKILSSYPLEVINKESFPLHYVYHCWLLGTEASQKSPSQFAQLLNIPYPRSWSLASHYIVGNITMESPWFKSAFLWEKRQLYRQLILYYTCVGDNKKTLEIKQLIKHEFVIVDS